MYSRNYVRLMLSNQYKTISKIKQDDKELDTNKTSSYLHSMIHGL
jgi:hypothetical protein